MNRRDIQAFVERDWGRVSASKEAYWVERKRILGPSEGLRIAEDLLRQARLVRPEFPTVEDRQMDLASHADLSELFRKIAAKPRDGIYGTGAARGHRRARGERIAGRK